MVWLPGAAAAGLWVPPSRFSRKPESPLQKNAFTEDGETVRFHLLSVGQWAHFGRQGSSPAVGSQLRPGESALETGQRLSAAPAPARSVRRRSSVQEAEISPSEVAPRAESNKQRPFTRRRAPALSWPIRCRSDIIALMRLHFALICFKNRKLDILSCVNGKRLS